eukprot:CAMPEP_0119469668 /NCGR_PEP_ID=MMETSP1344-20130328/2892_1 /TAXON_ID=236787 /ORGANISM="Florenciella parvula, Strain CCMP2471" /LENGTH=84 /DNA_ID=CAMNT_0007502249 /DNA_START=129 /DNA_END=379 /DNA_ORIENTATION=-
MAQSRLLEPRHQLRFGPENLEPAPQQFRAQLHRRPHAYLLHPLVTRREPRLIRRALLTLLRSGGRTREQRRSLVRQLTARRHHG